MDNGTYMVAKIVEIRKEKLPIQRNQEDEIMYGSEAIKF